MVMKSAPLSDSNIMTSSDHEPSQVCLSAKRNTSIQHMMQHIDESP